MLGHVWLFATPWAVVSQASLSVTISWSLLKLMSTESVMPSNHFISCRSLLRLPLIHTHMPTLTLDSSPIQFSSVQFSRSVVSDSLQPHGLQHARPPCPSPNSRVYPNSCPLSWSCYPTILSSVVPFSSCLQSFAASGSFQIRILHIRWPKYWHFSFSISPSNEHPGLISLLSKGLSRVFSNTTVQKHQFFCAQLSLYSNFHIHTWPLEKP